MLPISTPRLVLRNFRSEDVSDFVAYRSDPEIARYQSWEQCSVEEAEALVRRQEGRAPRPGGDWFQIALALRESGGLIGDCGLKLETRQATVGITLGRRFQGQGYGREALSAIFDHLFDRTDVRRIVADTDPDNVSAWSLLERLGMRREGHLKASLWFKGRWADEYLYAILREEWMPGSPRRPSRPVPGFDESG